MKKIITYLFALCFSFASAQYTRLPNAEAAFGDGVVFGGISINGNKLFKYGANWSYENEVISPVKNIGEIYVDYELAYTMPDLFFIDAADSYNDTFVFGYTDINTSIKYIDVVTFPSYFKRNTKQRLGREAQPGFNLLRTIGDDILAITKERAFLISNNILSPLNIPVENGCYELIGNDLLFVGNNSTTLYQDLLNPIPLDFEPLSDCDIAIDGDVIAIAGRNESGEYKLNIYINYELSQSMELDGTGYLVFGDLNGDNHNDLFLSSGNFSRNQAYIFYNNGANHFVNKEIVSGISLSRGAALIVDIDGDGKNDILTTGARYFHIKNYILKNEN